MLATFFCFVKKKIPIQMLEIAIWDGSAEIFDRFRSGVLYKNWLSIWRFLVLLLRRCQKDCTYMLCHGFKFDDCAGGRCGWNQSGRGEHLVGWAREGGHSILFHDGL